MAQKETKVSFHISLRLIIFCFIAGSFCGSLSSCKAHELGSVVIKAVIEKANLSNADISEVVMGQALQAGQGQNPARQAAVGAGIPYSTPAYTVNMLCGSGLKAISLAYNDIRSNESDIVVAGGQEVMSQAPHVLNVRNGLKMGNSELVDSMLKDGLIDAFYNIHMGETGKVLILF